MFKKSTRLVIWRTCIWVSLEVTYFSTISRTTLQQSKMRSVANEWLIFRALTFKKLYIYNIHILPEAVSQNEICLIPAAQRLGYSTCNRQDVDLSTTRGELFSISKNFNCFKNNPSAVENGSCCPSWVTFRVFSLASSIYVNMLIGFVISVVSMSNTIEWFLTRHRHMNVSSHPWLFVALRLFVTTWVFEECWEFCYLHW